ncbi:MAG: MFS transporter [Anaerolineales bacterium]|nr:MFS transporter [Anaerolineales bacterium]
MNSVISISRPRGLQGLFIIWLGQMVSGTASSIAFFALPAWILGRTQSSGNALGSWESLYFGSYLLMILFAGVFVDRYPRKAMMLVYDILSLAAALMLLILERADALALWHLYLAAIFQGVGYAFQSPSYSAAITTMVSKKNFVRANGFIALLDSAPGIIGPVLAVLLFRGVGLSGILALNLLSYAVSIAALLIVDVPLTPHTQEGEQAHGEFFKEAMYGVRYILKRPGLLGVQLIFFFGNFFSGVALSVTSLFTMVSLRTGGDPSNAGTAQSAAAFAALVVGIFLTVVGGIRRPVRAILLGWILSSLFGLTLLGIGQLLIFWIIAAVVDAAFEPVVNVSLDSFLQTKIPPDVQGRVFAASDFLAQAMIPLTPLVAGFLGEGIFEPAMAEGGQLVRYFGWIVGTGPGSGFGLMIFLCGIAGTLIGLSGYLVRAIRDVDVILPDFDTLPKIKNPIKPEQSEKQKPDIKPKVEN